MYAYRHTDGNSEWALHFARTTGVWVGRDKTTWFEERVYNKMRDFWSKQNRRNTCTRDEMQVFWGLAAVFRIGSASKIYTQSSPCFCPTRAPSSCWQYFGFALDDTSRHSAAHRKFESMVCGDSAAFTTVCRWFCAAVQSSSRFSLTQAWLKLTKSGGDLEQRRKILKIVYFFNFTLATVTLNFTPINDVWVYTR